METNRMSPTAPTSSHPPPEAEPLRMAMIARIKDRQHKLGAPLPPPVERALGCPPGATVGRHRGASRGR